MQRISLEHAAPGMKLAKPAKNKRGMTLCGAGAELSEDMIARLSDMGIKRITVEGHPVDTEEEEKSLSQQIDELNTRFRKVERNPLMRKVKKIFLELLEERAKEA